MDHKYHRIELIGIYNAEFCLAQGFKYKAPSEDQIHYNCNDLRGQFTIDHCWSTPSDLIFTKISFLQKNTSETRLCQTLCKITGEPEIQNWEWKLLEMALEKA